MKSFKEYIDNALTEAKGYTVEVEVRDARKANDLAQDRYRGLYKNDGSNVFVFKKESDKEDFEADLVDQGLAVLEESLNETPTKINTRTWNIHKITLANLKQELLKGSNAKFAERVVSIVKQEPTKYGWIITCLMEDNNEVANKVEFVISVKEVDVSMV